MSNNIPKIRFKGFTHAWEQRTLGEVVDFFPGLTYSPDNIIANKGTLVLRSSNVSNGEIIDADNVYVESNVVNCANVEIGDVIVVVRNGSRSLIGKHAQIKYHMENTVIGAFMTGLRSNQSQFINSLLDTQQFDFEITKNLGATINQITTGAFKKMIFTIPFEESEQTAIGNFFRTLDDAITLHKRKLEGLKELKSAYLQQMFPQAGEDLPRVRFAGFTGDWKKRKLGEMVEKLKSYSLSRDVETKEETGYRYIHYGDIHKQVADLIVTDKQLPCIKISDYIPLNRGDLVLADASEDYTGIAEPSIILHEPQEKIIAGLHTIALRPQNTNALYLYYLLHTDTFKKYGCKAGTGLKVFGITFDNLSIFETTIPIIEEQIAIGYFFYNFDCIIEKQKIKLDKLKQLKSAYLQKLFV